MIYWFIPERYDYCIAIVIYFIDNQCDNFNLNMILNAMK